MTAERAKWLPEVEGLRALAFLFVVFSHAFALLNGIPHTPAQIGVLGALLAVTRVAVPAFLVISSILLTRTLQHSPLAQRWPAARRLLVSYVAWTVIFAVVTKVLYGTSPVMAWTLLVEIVRDLYTAGAAGHLWYVLVALQVYLVVPVLLWWFQGNRAATVVLYVTWLTLLNIILLGRYDAPGSERNVLLWIAYIALGVALGLSYDEAWAWIRRRAVWIIGVWLVLATALAFLVFSRSLVVGGEYYQSIDPGRITQPWIVPFEMLSVVAWLLIASYLMRTPLAAPLRLIADVSLGAYLIHPLAIYAFGQWILGYVEQPNAILAVMGSFACATVFSVAASAGLARTNWGAFLVGKEPPHAHATDTSGAGGTRVSIKMPAQEADTPPT